jgi:2-dehydropantoate 2-reductase
VKLTVFGAGGVGGHIAVRLAMSGVEVNVIARGPHLDAMCKHGLTLEIADEIVNCEVNATDRPMVLGPQDLVVVCVKGTSLPDAIESIDHLCGPQTRVLFVMNGLPCWFADGLPITPTAKLRNLLDPQGNIRELAPPDRTIWGVVSAGGMITAPGVIRNTTPNNNILKLGYPDNHDDRFITELAAMFAKAGYNAKISGDIRVDIWLKLLMNAGPVMVAALTGRDNRENVSDPETRMISIACMRELAEIGRAVGVHTQADFEQMTDPSRVAAHRSSFLQDLDAGRPLELPGTILAARELAAIAGVPVPHLTTLAALIAARSAHGVYKTGLRAG